MPEGNFLNVCVTAVWSQEKLAGYSVLNTLLENRNRYFDISKNLTSSNVLLVFKIVESLQ